MAYFHLTIGKQINYKFFFGICRLRSHIAQCFRSQGSQEPDRLIALAPNSCMILGKSLNLYVTQSPYLWNEDSSSTYFLESLWELNVKHLEGRLAYNECCTLWLQPKRVDCTAPWEGLDCWHTFSPGAVSVPSTGGARRHWSAHVHCKWLTGISFSGPNPVACRCVPFPNGSSNTNENKRNRSACFVSTSQ